MKDHFDRARTTSKATTVGTALRLVCAVSLVCAVPFVSPTAGIAAPSALRVTWDSRSDFETNASGTGAPTTRRNLSTAKQPGSLTLAGPFTDVSAGQLHTVGLKSDGTVVATGQNTYGQCDVSAWADVLAVSAGGQHTVALKPDGTVVATGRNSSKQCNVSEWTEVASVSAGSEHTVGLRSDGTVVAVGRNDYGQCNVGGWSDIVQVRAGYYHTVGVKSDGTVVATGYNHNGECNVGEWSDVVAVSASALHTVGLKDDGTVIATGYDEYGQCGVSGWSDIVAVAAGELHTLGVRADGTVVAAGDNSTGQSSVSGWDDVIAVSAGLAHTVALTCDGSVAAIGRNSEAQCNVSGWSTVVAVVTGASHTVGLRSDGTVVGTGYNYNGECNVGGWDDVVQIEAGEFHTVGLKSDGTVVATGMNELGQCDVSGWSDIVQVTAGGYHTAGLKSDGTVVTTGYNNYGQRNVSSWTDVTQVVAGYEHTLGLKSDGAVVATGNNTDGRCNVGGWSDVVSIAAGFSHSVAAKMDGTAVATGFPHNGECNVGGWSDVVEVAAGAYYTLGLKSDGTVVATLNDASGQYDVSGWNDVVSVAGGNEHTVALTKNGTVVSTGDNYYGQRNVDSWSRLPLSARTGNLGGAGGDTGLRFDASEVAQWKSLECGTGPLGYGEAVKFAVRTSDDGSVWSEPVGTDGQPVDWTSGSGNYFGRAAGDASWRTDLSAIDDCRCIDVVVRLESAGVNSPELRSVTLEYEGNQAPVATPDSYATPEDTALVLAVPGVLGNDTDADGDTLAAQVTVQPAHGALSMASDGSFTYNPAADFNGTDTFTYRAYDGAVYSPESQVTIEVTAVNDAPSFVTGPDITVAEDSGAYSQLWATSISAGPLSESGQKLAFSVACNAPALFSAQPSMAPNGTLSFTPAPDAHGSAKVTVTLTDDNTVGGPALSHTRTFTIAITPVADSAQVTLLSGSKTLAKHGEKYAVAGTLTSKGAALAGKTVLLQSGPNVSALSATGRVAMTDQLGNFNFDVVPSATTFYQVVYAGEGTDHLAATSAAISVKPRAWVAKPQISTKSRSHGYPAVKHGKSYTVSSYLKPKHKAGPKAATLKIYYRTSKAKKWKSYKAVAMKAADYKGYSKLTCKVKLPKGKRYWLLRVEHPTDSANASAKSSDYVIWTK